MPILVMDYDPAWPAQFETLRGEIASLLGDLVQSIDHIGSTAVPGQAAKPKIDIDAVLVSDSVMTEAVARIAAGDGFTHHGDRYGDGMQIFTRGKVSGARLYLCGPGNAKHIKRLLFRDYLRTHEDARADYATLKRRLAAEAGDDWDAYTPNKSDFVNRIVALASEERSAPA